MKGNLLSKYAASTPAETAPAAAPEVAQPDDLGAFGYLRGVHERAIMLEVRHKNGRIDSFGYAWLNRASFDPSEGITLHFGAEQVTIIGRNLNVAGEHNVRLFEAIDRHRVPWIQEADNPGLLRASAGSTVVELVKIGG